ncbi:hypothetical protein ANCCAN_24030 [Ancylostoma caninum]|uniref:Uncharacterized protein n=1 Tax=Ancylostoma caninum TaxID=29170 RepID=A0A368FDI7_ANCCA|nr:hypothetical protein ANCCAN_24030 [Ancylostoma caninum]
MVAGSLRKSYKSESEGTPHKKRLQSKVWDSLRGTAAAHEPHWRCLQGFQKCFAQKMPTRPKCDRRSAVNPSSTPRRSTEPINVTSVRRSPRIAAMSAIEKQLENLKL